MDKVYETIGRVIVERHRKVRAFKKYNDEIQASIRTTGEKFQTELRELNDRLDALISRIDPSLVDEKEEVGCTDK